jgi:hypothetical protein
MNISKLYLCKRCIDQSNTNITIQIQVVFPNRIRAQHSSWTSNEDYIFIYILFINLFNINNITPQMENGSNSDVQSVERSIWDSFMLLLSWAVPFPWNTIHQWSMTIAYYANVQDFDKLQSKLYLICSSWHLSWYLQCC